MYKYKYLYGEKDSYGGIKWEFDSKTYQDKDLIQVLNDIGNDGWQLVSKESNTRFIMMKKINLIKG